MARFTSYLNPALVDNEGLIKYLNRLFGPGVATAFNSNGWKVSQRGAGANMSVDVAVGDGLLNLPTGGYGFWGWTTATENVAVTSANPTNPRIDVVVAWVDTSVTTTGTANSPNALKFQIMAGTPAGSPVAMNDATIQSTLGSSVAWIKLATIAVAAGSTSVVNANISDARTGITTLPPLPANSVDASVVLQDNSVITRKLKPTVVNFKDPSTTGFTTTSTSYIDVTGVTISYTSGPTNEKVLVIAKFMWQQTSAGNGNARLMGNGVAGSEEAYVDNVPVNWRGESIAEWFDWPANTTGTIKLQAKVTGGSLSVSKGGTSTSQSWAPSIKGFAIGR